MQGVFESGYWNQYWSVSMDMTAQDGSPDQSVKWNNKAPAYFYGDPEDAAYNGGAAFVKAGFHG